MDWKLKSLCAYLQTVIWPFCDDFGVTASPSPSALSAHVSTGAILLWMMTHSFQLQLHLRKVFCFCSGLIRSSLRLWIHPLDISKVFLLLYNCLNKYLQASGKCPQGWIRSVMVHNSLPHNVADFFWFSNNATQGNGMFEMCLHLIQMSSVKLSEASKNHDLIIRDLWKLFKGLGILRYVNVWLWRKWLKNIYLKKKW